MKNNLIYAIAAILIAAASLIKVMHWPGANVSDIIMQATIIPVTFYLMWQNQLLTKKLKEIQNANH
jgi:hypothetical protein